MHFPRANSNSDIAWIIAENIYFTPDPGFVNWAKHLYPLRRSPSESPWNAVEYYSEIPQLENLKRLAMFASGIPTRGANIANAAVLLASDTDISYLKDLIIKARSPDQSNQNMLVMGKLSHPISLLLDVSCNRFLYIHMSDYNN